MKEEESNFHLTEPVRLEFQRKKLIGDMETESEHFCATGSTMREAKEGITFLLESQKLIARKKGG